MFRAAGVAVLAVCTLTSAAQDSAPGPPMPFHDIGVCPHECCIYRDWTATKRMNAWRYYDETGSPRLFAIVPGERVTAMSGVVVTTEPGIIRITAPVSLAVTSRRFPRSPAENVPLHAGDTLYLLATYGEGERGGWYKGRVLERFDGTTLRPLEAVIEREPTRAWWVKVRNVRGQIGWVRGEDAFRDPGGC